MPLSRAAIATNAMLGVVGVHVGGVLLGSWLHHQNLVRSMITGRKPGLPQQAIGERYARGESLVGVNSGFAELDRITGGFIHHVQCHGDVAGVLHLLGQEIAKHVTVSNEVDHALFGTLLEALLRGRRSGR